MGNSKNIKILRLNTSSRWSGEQYIGYVLETINKHLYFGMEEYNLGGGRLSEARFAEMTNGSRQTIRITKLDRRKYYAVEGWPDDRSWWWFRWRARGLLKEFLKR